MIELTEKGIEAAGKIYNRHNQLTEFLAVITGVSKEQAEANACRIEHVIDEEVFAGILTYMRTHKSD
jgi:Mn-dependent DtxR family transcriptional regulator